MSTPNRARSRRQRRREKEKAAAARAREAAEMLAREARRQEDPLLSYLLRVRKALGLT